MALYIILVVAVFIGIAQSFVVNHAFTSSRIQHFKPIAITRSSELVYMNSQLFQEVDTKQSENIVSNQLQPLSCFSCLSIVSMPTLVLADSGDKNAFLFPLVISLLTMIPFLYYAQALQPKERTVKQIEVDPKTLKAIDKKNTTGSTTEARARKK